ncbi:MAG: biopolymer transporter ExbD [Sneathiella sp.]
MRLPQQNSAGLSIGLTPLIDVVFILLIFFMLVTNFDGLRLIDLSVTSGKSSAVITPKKTATLHVLTNGECLFKQITRPCSKVRTDIEEALSISFSNTEQPINLYLKPGERTKLQDMLDAIDALSTSGIQNVLLAEGD